MRFPFSVKLSFDMVAFTTLSEQARPLAKLYIASASEQTAPFLETFRWRSGGYREMLPGTAILLNGVVQTVRRGGEIGVPGVSTDAIRGKIGIIFRGYCSFPAFLSSLNVMLSSQIISVSFQSGSSA